MGKGRGRFQSTPIIMIITIIITLIENATSQLYNAQIPSALSKMNADMADAPEENTCRICRGEATEEAPLFYPCKCRGSIKYIHQDCLEEWIKHSNKKDVACDICHQKYKFTTLYADDTPDRVPFRLIAKRLWASLCSYAPHVFMVAQLVVGVVIQIPLCWAVSGRFITWLVDGVTLHQSFLTHMIYGDHPLPEKENDWISTSIIVGKAWLISAFTISLLISFFVVLFNLYEQVVDAPGFAKLIRRNIGEERVGRGTNLPQGNRARARAAPPLAARPLGEHNQRLGEAVRDLENLQRLVEDVNDMDNPVVAEAFNRLVGRHFELQRAIRDAQRGDNDNNQEGNQEDNQEENQDGLLAEEDEIQDPDFVPDDASDSFHSDGDDVELDDADEFERFRRFDEANHQAGDDLAARLRQRVNAQQQHLVNRVPDIPNLPNNNRIPVPLFDNADFDLDEPIRPPAQAQNPVRRNVERRDPPVARLGFGGLGVRPVPPAAAVAPIVGRAEGAARVPAQQPFDNEVEDFLNSLNPSMIIVIADLVIVTFLTLFYCVPSIVGTILFQLLFYLGEASIVIKSRISDYLGLRSDKPYVNYRFIYEFLKGNLPSFMTAFENSVTIPLFTSLTRVYSQSEPLSTSERMVPLILFYGLGLFAILSYLKVQETTHGPTSPLLGFQRKLYIFWFSVISTLKVTTIFVIEMLVFPTCIGVLMLFVLAPLTSTGSSWATLRSFLF